MSEIMVKELPAFFQGVADIFAENRDRLCEMDAKMGDGDLGLTMSKGFGALPGLIGDNLDETSVGKTLMKAGMKMQGLVPSTMGTLMSSGIMQGAKAVGAKPAIGPEELAAFFTGFAEGLAKRGKCQPGDCTVYDSVKPAGEAAVKAYEGGADLKEILQAACQAVGEGVEATKAMIPKYGKAAVHSAKADGVPDQGAVAGQLFFEGLARYFA